MDEKDALPGQAILMLAVALEELESTKGEATLAKVRMRIAAIEGTLKELLSLAKSAAGEPGRLGL